MEQTVYYRLHDRRGYVIGFMRIRGARVHYVDLHAKRWSRRPITYVDRVRLNGALPGFGYLKG